MTETSTPATQVLIVGAGPTGLMLALWLTRLGIRVRIIDKTVEPLTTSRALGVQARTLEFYGQMGMASELVENGVKTPGINLWVKDTRRARVPLQQMGEGLSPFPFLLIFSQDTHERLLSEHLDALGVQVERQTTLLSFEQGPEGTRGTLQHADGSQEICTAIYLAGCDGAHSSIREALAIDFPGGIYSRYFYVADVDASGPTVNGELHIDLDEADLLAVFPMKGEGHIRLIGTVREGSEKQHRELTFADANERAIQKLRLTIEKVNWFSTYHVYHRVASHFREGHVFLLGDAAHIHSPLGAQGMNTGMGDAVNLAWKLAAVLKREAPDNLLDSYEKERISFARRLVATTDRLFTLVTKQGPLARRVRTVLVPLLAPSLLRLTLVRRFFFRTISQIGITYRDSPLSAGVAGTIHSGDRLPWVQTTPGDDNFAPLTTLAWQVHMYGKPRGTGKSVR